MYAFRLRYQHYPVMDIMIDITKNGFCTKKVTKIYNREALPVALKNVSEHRMVHAFDEWYKERLISSDNVYVTRIASLLCGTPNMQIENPYGLIMNLSLLSYGRNLTDKYWIAPIRQTIYFSGYEDCNLNGRVLLKKDNYKGLDFTKNGIAPNYSNLLLNNNAEVKENIDFNFPDLCTRGKRIKRVYKDSYGFVWMEKYCVDKDSEKSKEKINNAIYYGQVYPDIFPKVTVINNGSVPIGYKTKCFTNENTELITFREFIAGAQSILDRKTSMTEQDFLDAVEKFGIDMKKYETSYSLAKQAFENESAFYENAGFIVSAKTREIIRLIAWI